MMAKNREVTEILFKEFLLLAGNRNRIAVEMISIPIDMQIRQVIMGPIGERTSATKPPTVPTIPAKFKAGLINFDSPANAGL